MLLVYLLKVSGGANQGPGRESPTTASGTRVKYTIRAQSSPPLCRGD